MTQKMKARKLLSHFSWQPFSKNIPMYAHPLVPMHSVSMLKGPLCNRHCAGTGKREGAGQECRNWRLVTESGKGNQLPWRVKKDLLGACRADLTELRVLGSQFKRNPHMRNHIAYRMKQQQSQTSKTTFKFSAPKLSYRKNKTNL